MRIQVTLRESQQGWTVTTPTGSRAVQFPQVLNVLAINWGAFGTPQTANVDERLYHAMFSLPARDALFAAFPRLFEPMTIRDNEPITSTPACPYRDGGFHFDGKHDRQIRPHPVSGTMRWKPYPDGKGGYWECPTCGYSREI